jgi:hypothetical protein
MCDFSRKKFGLLRLEGWEDLTQDFWQVAMVSKRVALADDAYALIEIVAPTPLPLPACACV